MSDLAQYIDHTLLKPDATRGQIETLCAEAAEHNFATVCVNGSRVELSHSLLEDCDVQVATVVGFPLGAMDADVKRYETEAAVDKGLAYLASTQEEDGRWNIAKSGGQGNHDQAATAFALLANAISIVRLAPTAEIRPLASSFLSCHPLCHVGFTEW